MTATITELGMSEEWFWKTEPRVVVNMINEKKKIDLGKTKLLAFYVSCYVWGKDPDENEKKKEVAGIDKPVSAEMLKAFNL